ncbi:MAG TPA: hypothetical protein P5137_16750, partial [Candidatus Brocadiia bacterium]|nr:hypothetical protein [Candidatus Brocadiia bacterium]
MLRGLHPKDIVVAVIIAAAVGGYFLWEKLAPRPSEEILAVIARMREAAEKGDAKAFLAELAAEYKGEMAKRAQITEYVTDYFREYGPTEVKVLNSVVTVEGVLAVANVTAQTRATNREKWGGDGVESSWLLKFARYGGRWYVDDIVPLTFMQQEVASFHFREELRKIAEATLAAAEKRLEVEAERTRSAHSARMAQMAREHEALLKRFPAESAEWRLDTFDDGALMWTPYSWGHPCALSVVERDGSKALKVVVSRSAKEKAGIGRPIELDMSSRAALRVSVYNDTRQDALLALAVKTNGEWYESPKQTLKPGANKGLEFGLRQPTFKTQSSGWTHKVALPGLDGIGEVFFLIYTDRPGVYFFDDIVAVAGDKAAGVESVPPTVAPADAGAKPADAEAAKTERAASDAEKAGKAAAESKPKAEKT